MTEANSRMARLETDPVLREEAETIRIMTAMYCRDRHGTSGRPDVPWRSLQYIAVMIRIVSASSRRTGSVSSLAMREFASVMCISPDRL